MIKRFFEIGALVGAAAVALLIFAGLSTTGTALADLSTPTPSITPTATATPDPLVQQTVNTNAVVGNSTAGPVVNCKWELPDMQVGITDTTFPDGRIQYGTALNAHLHDDDPVQMPSVNPACHLPASGDVTQSPNITDMIQVVPVPQNNPEQRHIQLWMVASDPAGTGLTGAFEQVFEPAPLTGPCHALPDGSIPPRVYDATSQVDMCEKIQVDATKVDKSHCSNNAAQSLGDAPAVGRMFNAAVETGQVSSAAVDSPSYGLNARCTQGAVSIYYSSFDLSKDQPCGMYRVDATAYGQAVSTLSNYLDVECVFYLKIDFNTVDWHSVTANVPKSVYGDLDWDNPADNAPTVMNVGNDGMGLGLIFSPMTSGPPYNKTITSFDACFGTVADGTLECIDPIAANTLVRFGVALTPPLLYPTYPAHQILCSDKMGKLDLSIHPTSSPTQPLVPATYTGTLTVIGRHVSNICQTRPINQELDGP